MGGGRKKKGTANSEKERRVLIQEFTLGGDRVRKKQPDWKFILPFFAALAIFIFAAAKLGMIYWEYSKGTQEYQALKKAALSTELESYVQTKKLADGESGVDFDKLRSINRDTAGWIRFENLGISYPIVQGKDNDYYLCHTFYRKENKCGSIFIETQNQKDFSDQNTFVYGHNMKDKSMFAKLNELKQEEVFRENAEFYIDTPKGVNCYQIFSCHVAPLESDSFRYQFQGKEDYAEWQKNVKECSLYETGVEPKKEQKTVTLMTCTPEGYDYRFLVHGVLKE